MFGTFRKHSTWLWAIIIGAMAVSLVIWTGNRTDRGGRGQTVNYGSISGKKVTQDAFNDAFREVKLQYFLSRKEWPDSGTQRQDFDLEFDTYRWLFLNQMQDEMGIHIAPEVVARMAAQELGSLTKRPQGSPAEIFEKTILKPHGLSLGDYERSVRHRLGVQQLIAAVGVSGNLVTPQEARSIYEREHQEISAQAAFFLASNYLASVVVTPSALSEFYSNQVARYRLPERVTVSYVSFEATNSWAEAGADMAAMTNQAGMSEMVRKYGFPPAFAAEPTLSSLIDKVYQNRGTNFYPNLTPDSAKLRIHAELQGQCAIATARSHASGFLDPIVSQEVIKSDSLAAAARKAGLAVRVTAPFDHSSEPAGLDVSEQFIKAAFALRDDEPIAGPIVCGDKIYVIAQDKRIPSEIPSFESVKASVERDYRMFQAVQAARTAGAAFATGVTNGMAAGKTFAALCAAAKTSPILLPPFSRSSRSLPDVEHHVGLEQFKQVAFGTEVGRPSPFVPTVEGGMVVYVQSKLPIDEKDLAANLPEFTALLRQARQSEAFEEWFSREAQTALADTPALRRRLSELNSTHPGK
jgi:peptidyl-prolyl cis-trans isomerase D